MGTFGEGRSGSVRANDYVGTFLADPISSLGPALLFGEYQPQMMRTMRPGSVVKDVESERRVICVAGKADLLPRDPD
jgi:hypothetical protein